MSLNSDRPNRCSCPECPCKFNVKDQDGSLVCKWCSGGDHRSDD